MYLYLLSFVRYSGHWHIEMNMNYFIYPKYWDKFSTYQTCPKI